MPRNTITLRKDRHGNRWWEVAFAMGNTPGCLMDLRILEGRAVLDIRNVEGMSVRVDRRHLAVGANDWRGIAPRTVEVGLTLLERLMDIPEGERDHTSGKVYNVDSEYLGESMDPVGLAHALILGKGSAPLILEPEAEPEEHELCDVARVDIEQHGPTANQPASVPDLRMDLGRALVALMTNHHDIRHMSAVFYRGDDCLGESFEAILAAHWLLSAMDQVPLFVNDGDGEGAEQNVDIRHVTAVSLRQR